MLEQIDFSPGVVVYNDFHVDKNKSLQEQEFDLKEDMLQVEFPQNLLLDVGWSPSFDINGKFVITVVKDSDWEEPVLLIRCKVDEFSSSIQRAIHYIREFLN